MNLPPMASAFAKSGLAVPALIADDQHFPPVPPDQPSPVSESAEKIALTQPVTALMDHLSALIAPITQAISQQNDYRQPVMTTVILRSDAANLVAINTHGRKHTYLWTPQSFVLSVQFQTIGGFMTLPMTAGYNLLDLPDDTLLGIAPFPTASGATIPNVISTIQVMIINSNEVILPPSAPQYAQKDLLMDLNYVGITTSFNETNILDTSRYRYLMVITQSILVAGTGVTLQIDLLACFGGVGGSRIDYFNDGAKTVPDTTIRFIGPGLANNTGITRATSFAYVVAGTGPQIQFHIQVYGLN